jgi:hypothetical protein
VYPLVFNLIVAVDEVKRVKFGIRIGHKHTYVMYDILVICDL